MGQNSGAALPAHPIHLNLGGSKAPDVFIERI
jgi:hypothetical protein